jgi:hypothetical protein
VSHKAFSDETLLEEHSCDCGMRCCSLGEVKLNWLVVEQDESHLKILIAYAWDRKVQVTES